MADVQASVRESQTGEREPTIVAFLCSWCGYTGADEAGVSGLQYPANVRIVQVPCAGRVNPVLVIKSLQRGIDGVLIVGCPPGNCHYTRGNYYAHRRLSLMKSLLEYVGVEPERVQITWVGATEGARFAQAVREMVAAIKELDRPQALVKNNRPPAQTATAPYPRANRSE